LGGFLFLCPAGVLFALAAFLLQGAKFSGLLIGTAREARFL
jgi:hypothetical protein